VVVGGAGGVVGSEEDSVDYKVSGGVRLREVMRHCRLGGENGRILCAVEVVR